MKLSLSRGDLLDYMNRQINTFFPDGVFMEGEDVLSSFNEAIERLEYCFKYLTFPAYSDQTGQTFFSHLHSDQYAQFLYYLSNTLWVRTGRKELCDKLMYLNRVLNGFFFSYKGKLPDVFFLGHPVGSILGNADYSNFLVVFQNVTINTAGTADHLLPKLGKGLFCAAGANIIGNKTIGERVSVGVGALVYDREIPDDSVVEHSADGSMICRPRRAEMCMAQNYFSIDVRTDLKSYVV